MNNDTFNHGDLPTFIERLHRLAGSTTFREPGGGHTPRKPGEISTDNAMAVALSLSRRNARDVGPEVAYAVGTGVPHRRRMVVHWLADKLLHGTGPYGRRAERQLLTISGQAYDLVIGSLPRIVPPLNAVPEFEVLGNIGAGWLWIAMEAAVERAERAMYGSDLPANLEGRESTAT